MWKGCPSKQNWTEIKRYKCCIMLQYAAIVYKYPNESYEKGVEFKPNRGLVSFGFVRTIH